MSSEERRLYRRVGGELVPLTHTGVVDLDDDKPALNITDFPRRYRFQMVQAYSIISGVDDPYAASHEEIDAGFRRCLRNRNLRRTHELFLESRSEKQR